MKKEIKTIAVKFFCLIAALMIFTPQSSAEEGVAISKGGTPISFSEYGKGEPTLIFVHGWSCNRSFWEKQISYFEKKYHVVTLDLAGHGSSGRERAVYSMEAFGEDVAAVVRKIGSEKVILVGHSMGGPVIIEAAEILQGQVIALIGIDTMHNLEETHTAQEIEEIVRPFKEDFKKTTDSFVRNNMFVPGTDSQLVDQIAGSMANASMPVGVSAFEEMFKRSYITDPMHIKVPVWCLNADLWLTKSEINRKYVPKFEVRIMPGVGHFLMLEKPDEFNRQLDDIIKEIVASS